MVTGISLGERPLGVKVAVHLANLLFQSLSVTFQLFGNSLVGGPKNAEGKESRIKPLTDGDRRHRNSTWHLNDGKKRILTAQVPCCDRNANHGQGGHGSNHSRKVSRSARSGNDHLQTSVTSGFGVLHHRLGRSMSAYHFDLVLNAELSQNLRRGSHRVPIGDAAHDDSHSCRHEIIMEIVQRELESPNPSEDLPATNLLDNKVLRMTRFPARLHVLLALQARVGVIIRRGPADRVATILWDRSNDTFTLGQWLKGRIYHYRSDLSFDGKYMIYFAINGKYHSESRGTWTAVSKAPYLKAIAFFPGGDTYGGGGLWTHEKSYWWNNVSSHKVARDTNLVKRDDTFKPPRRFGEGDKDVYYYRLYRDGWEWISLDRSGDVFEKNVGLGWVLRKSVIGGAGTWQGRKWFCEEHQLVGREEGQLIDCPNWEWADLDVERLVWAEGGKLFAANISKDGLQDVKELCDFNDMKFEERIAPY